jgi:glutamyl-tRNA synthetase
MEITHVLRGEDLLSSTPRQIALYDALAQLGIGNGPPRFGHLPMVMGEGNKRLSKRDKVSGLSVYIERGFLPEGVLNYLALLGWGIADDRDVFSMAEMIEAFDIRRVNPNAAHLRALPTTELAERIVPFLQRAKLIGDEPTDDEQRLLDAVAPLIQERMTTLGEVVDMAGFLFVAEADFLVDPDDAARLLDPEGRRVVQASYDALSGLSAWDTATIETALRTALVDDMGLKPRNAFGPVRVAVTGRRISPPLFESLELLGSERSLARLAAAATG